MNKPWIALFSHSGKEIYQISTAIAKKPDVILTTNLDANTWFPSLLHGFRVGIPFDENMHDVFDTLRMDEWKDAIITLHPGLINYYSELRGKDPQEKTWDNIESYQFIGSVVHKVTDKIDDTSTIKTYCMVNNTCNSKKEVYNTLRRTSLVSWLQFFDMVKGTI